MTQAETAIHQDIDSPENSPTTTATAVLVLGMHRSGTSALARILNLAGVELGNDLLPPAADNEMGFWEHRQIQFIHDRIYEDLERDWTHVSPLPDKWWEREEIQPRREQLKLALQNDFENSSLWGVKDPRLCAMLPLWIPLLAELHAQPKCVLIFRNPLEIAKSLEKRDKMAASRTYLLWMRSVIESEKLSRGLPRVLTTFGRVLADWQTEIDRIQTALQIKWTASPQQLADAVSEFIRPSSRHHQIEDQGFLTDDQVPEPVRRLYSAALAAVESGQTAEFSAVVDEVSHELDHNQPLAGFVRTLESEQRTATIHHNKKEVELNSYIGAWYEQAQSTVAALAEQEKKRLENEQLNAQLTAQLQQTSQALDQTSQNLAQAAQTLAQTSLTLEQRSAELQQTEVKLQHLQGQYNTQQELLAKKTHLVEMIQTEQIETHKELGKISAEHRQMRTELTAAYKTRDRFGESLRKLWQSGSWKWGRLGWMWARATGGLDRGIDDLVPLTEATRRPDGSWEGKQLPHFLIPTVPLVGWVRVRAKIHSSVASRAALYFDTGSSFHQREHFELAPVAGDTEIDRMVALRVPTHLIRFDPVQAGGDFVLESFSLEPMSRIGFNTAAILRNLKKLITGSGSHRPSIWLGLKLLLSGNIGKFHRQLVNNVESSTAVSEYDLWRKRHEITDESRWKMKEEMARWENPPKISVIMPVYNVPEIYLRKCIDSVLNQIYPNWELCIADDASPKAHIKKVLREYEAKDSRIKVVYQSTNGGISIASNAAIKLATGEYIALLDHDDELAEHALFRMAEAIVADPTVDMIYSDEDKMTPAGKHHDPFFKPDWSPEYFLACMYTCHLGVYRTELVKKVGGWRKEFDSAQDYDLVLRITGAGAKVHHIPDVLYHWRTIPTSTAANTGAKPEASQRAERALQEHLKSTNRPGRVVPGPSDGFHRIRFDIKGNPLVSIVIPSACREIELHGRKTWFVLECVASIRRLSTYKNIEIVVLDNNDMSKALADALSPYDVRKVPYTEPFNLARKMNTGGFAAKGEHLILLNDDIEVITPDWIEAMLEFSQWDEIGVVGAQLLFPNENQQHNGVNLLEGNPGHPFYQFPGDHPGYFNSSVVHRNWSAVTGACLMTRKDVYQVVGGFSEHFPLNYNDVDYCLKVRELGKRVVYMPYAKLYHHESVSKDGTDQAELEAFKKEWADKVPVDPYYNPNLTMQTCDFRIG